MSWGNALFPIIGQCKKCGENPSAPFANNLKGYCEDCIAGIAGHVGRTDIYDEERPNGRIFDKEDGEDEEDGEDSLELFISELQLDNEIEGILSGKGISRVGDLVEYTEEGLLAIKGMGNIRVARIKTALWDHGELKLHQPLPHEILESPTKTSK